MINKNYTKEQYLQIENKKRFWMSNNHLFGIVIPDQPQVIKDRAFKKLRRKGVKR